MPTSIEVGQTTGGRATSRAVAKGELIASKATTHQKPVRVLNADCGVGDAKRVKTALWPTRSPELIGRRQVSGLPAWGRTAIEERLAAKAGKVS